MLLYEEADGGWPHGPRLRPGWIALAAATHARPPPLTFFAVDEDLTERPR